QHQPAVLQLQQIDLSELITALQQKQFALSGQINGALPLYLQDANWWVRDGWLANRNSLTLRLDQQLADDISADNLSAGVALEWLRYLEIYRSSATVNLDKQGNMTLSARIKGYNTQKSRQKVVQLNYNHSENIFQLWRSLRFGDNVQEWINESATWPKRGKHE
ncbi:MAG: intermembrane phospholipid transport protein YdbH family protein, partial [Enterobacteriaceae bacterium]